MKEKKEMVRVRKEYVNILVGKSCFRRENLLKNIPNATKVKDLGNRMVIIFEDMVEKNKLISINYTLYK